MSETLWAVEEINEEIWDDDNMDSALDFFMYSTDGSIEFVHFHDHMLWNSEDDGPTEDSNGELESIKEFLKRTFNEYVESLIRLKFDL
jgi:hypothetical protein